MGLVLDVFQKEGDKKFKGFVPDFDNATVDEKCAGFYSEIEKKLAESYELISQLKGYTSSQESIRLAMTNPTAANKHSSFEEILKNVEKIKVFYNYCNNDLVKLFQKLRLRIEEVHEEKLEESEKLKRQEAWAKQLALLISFVVQWDQGKMQEPSLLNDFSYYKRHLARQANDFNLELDVEERLASTISFWLAESMPMCKTLGESLKDQKSQKLLKDISELCCSLVKNKKFIGQNSINNEMLCVRCAVGCIVLYDRAAGGRGAFGSKSFKTKQVCSVLASYGSRTKNAEELCGSLKSVIRYGCQSYGQYASKVERRCIGDL